MLGVMGFDRPDGTRSVLLQKREELFEIDVPLSHRQVFVALAMIVMYMTLDDIPAELAEPLLKGYVREHVPVAHIETVPETGIVNSVKQRPDRRWFLLEDVFDREDRFKPMSHRDKFLPEIDAVFQPDKAVVSIAKVVIAGVNDDNPRTEHFGGLHDLPDAMPGYRTDARIDRSRIEIEERGVDRSFQSGGMQRAGQ